MFTSILFPVDNSSYSLAPLKTVIDLARLAGAKVVILSVAEPRLFRASARDAVQTGRELEATKVEEANSNTLRACAAASEAGIACETTVLLAPVPEDEIVETARRLGCDLIVMATRGKMGVLDTLFSESTTQAVIRNSPVPVLVFP